MLNYYFLLTISIVHLRAQVWPYKVVWQSRGQVQFAISPGVLGQWNVGHQIIKSRTRNQEFFKARFLFYSSTLGLLWSPLHKKGHIWGRWLALVFRTTAVTVIFPVAH